MAMYHEEPGQEAFLVLHGECLLIVEGEERTLEAWEFVHCPPNTKHVIVGAGDRPALILAVGRARAGDYPRRDRDPPRAGVDKETKSPAEAYASYSGRRGGPAPELLPSA